GITSIANAGGSITMTPQSGGSVIINQTTISSTPSSGALVVNGGLGVGGAVNVQDSVSAASFTSSGGITAQTTTAATAGANQSSPNLALTANFWNGTASTVDRWTISNQMGTGTNPVSTLMFAHPAGTTGAKRIAFPAGSMVIGAQNPGAGKLTVDGGNILVRREDADSAVVLMTNSATANPNLILQRGQGDLTTAAYPADGDTLGAISFRNSIDNTSNAAEIRSIASGAHSASARGSALQFTVTSSGTTTSAAAMTIQNDGKVGIGVGGTVAAALEVNGAIKMGSMTACASAQEGSQRYNSTLKIMEFCDGIAWQSFTGTGLVPSGAVMAFDLASCPTGWTAYASGQNRVIVGSGGSYALGVTGGANSATTSTDGSHSHSGNTGSTAISVAQMPSHTHGVNDPGHTHGVYDPGHSHTINDDGCCYAATGNEPDWRGGSGHSSGTSVSTTGIGIYAAGTGISIQANGSGAGHTHSLSADGSHSHTVDTRQPYVALLLCRKN
ncbi:MAG: hypothetical protein KF681_18720, partial [Bdellovibrionaceae bacterium]|nr:hypothetical protein [Pseudobdellovibrionaceae bacterium]